MAWVRVDTGILSHNKIYKLQELLDKQGVKDNYSAVGIVVSVWAWAMHNAYDGDLTNFPAKAVADAVRWKKSPAKLVDALVESGFLDREGDRLLIHDWIEYAELQIDKEDQRRKQTKERVKKYRNRKKDATERNADVTQNSVTSNADVTRCNAPYDNDNDNDNDNDKNNNPKAPPSPPAGGMETPRESQPGVSIHVLKTIFESVLRVYPGDKPKDENELSATYQVFAKLCCQEGSGWENTAYDIKTAATRLLWAPEMRSRNLKEWLESGCWRGVNG